MSSTITANNGGILVGGSASFRASIIDHGASACRLFSGATIRTEGYNIDRGDSCNFHAVGDRAYTDPMLAPIGDNSGYTPTHALLPGSPAIDAIPAYVNINSPGVIPATDQRGISRPQYPGMIPGVALAPWALVYDIGAYELIPSTTTTLLPIL